MMEEEEAEAELNDRSASGATKIPSQCTATCAAKATATIATRWCTAKALGRSTSGYPSKNTWRVRKTMAAAVLRLLLLRL